MTDTDQIIALAELDGLNICSVCGNGVNAHIMVNHNHAFLVKEMPHYLADLNAVHELEKKFMGDGPAAGVWVKTLYKIIAEQEFKSTDIDLSDLEDCAHATARQRCEAILRATGKWTE